MNFQKAIQLNQTKYIRLDISQCRGCWKCVEICPKQVLGKVQKGPHRRVQIVFSDNCTGCKKCVNACKHKALEYLIIPNVRNNLVNSANELIHPQK